MLNYYHLHRHIYFSMEMSDSNSASEDGGRFRIHGFCCAPCTPMKTDGSLNLDIIPDYIDHFVEFGVKNAFLTGTAGEGMSLTMTERKMFVGVWLRNSKGKLSANIVHIGTMNLADSQELARHAEDNGADAIACVSPCFFKPPDIESYSEYMRLVASAAPNTPFYLYDFDAMTGVPYSAHSFLSQSGSRIPTLCGVKHTSVNFDSLQSILLDRPDLQVLMGNNHMFLQGLALGVEVTVGNSHYGVVMGRMIDAFTRGDMTAARTEQERIMKLYITINRNASSIPEGVKMMQKILGLDCGQPRLPLSSTSDQQMRQLQDDLTHIGFYDWGVNKHKLTSPR